MTDLVSYSSSIGRLEIHVSFKIKYCHRIFDSTEIKNRCKSIFEEVASTYKIFLKELGFDRDHIHMVVMLNPSMSVSSMAKLFKGTSGYKLLKEFPELKRKFFWGSGLWSPVIYFDSVGQSPELISNYVRNQGQYSG